MTDTDREAFEAWAKSKGAPKQDWWIRQLDDGGYSCFAVDLSWEAYQTATQQSAARIAALEAEVLVLRKDAERYKWLRSVPNGFKAQRIVNDTPHGMDAAIDAAIEAERGGA